MLQLKKYREKLADLCNKSLVINKLYMFGSAVSPRFNEATSDVDILVETVDLSPEVRGEELINLWNNLEILFSRKVDLVTANSLRNPYFINEVERTKQLIYDRQSQKIFI